MEQRLDHFAKPFFIDKEVNGYSVYGDGIAWLNEYEDGLELDIIEWSKFELYPSRDSEVQIVDWETIDLVKEYIAENYFKEIYNSDF